MCWTHGVNLCGLCVRLFQWAVSLCGDQFISPAAEQARQSISASASKHKWFTVLIASCLPHESPDRRTAIMESVGTAQALLLPFECVASILTGF